jgi:putative SOS response-associated peptidase YedK
MCGRFTQTHAATAIAQAFNLDELPAWEPSYNIAPTQTIPAIRQGADSRRQFQSLRWGLIPSWSKDMAIGARLINARAETVAEKPSFRSAFRQRRCLIIADGFYEWQRSDGKKQPFYIHLHDRSLFAFAGLWERWQGAEGKTIESCTILTTTPNSVMEPIHDRMPVILSPDCYDIWLDCGSTPTQELQALLRPYSATEMAAFPVSNWVNSPSHNDVNCVART